MKPHNIKSRQYRTMLALAGAGVAKASRRRPVASKAVASVEASIGREELQALGQPASLWKHFAALSSIPRPSKQEAAVLDYIRSFAEERQLQWQEDACGNLLLRRPGSGGGEAAEPVLLQGHVDMVCEKNAATAHDFSRDPIRLRVDGEWLRATGTTLGADNGVGVAAALAVLELGNEVPLPPIEALFTVDEETGLTGAMQLEGGMIKATRMLNLDTEEFGSLYIGCAGGGNSVMELPAVRSSAVGSVLNVEVTGLLGGHSGINIHEGRGNAVLMAVALAADIVSKVPEARLVGVRGGDKHNAIPREASAAVALPQEALSRAAELVAAKAESLRAEFGLLETKLNVASTASSDADSVQAFSREDSERILAALQSVPHGVIKMSHAIEGLVETSNNVASVDSLDEAVKVVLSTRSSLSGALEAARDRLEAIARLAGGTFKRGETYPGWAPSPKSPLVSLATAKLSANSGVEPKILAIHAGLECGLLLEKCPCIKQCVSFGPTITGAHSPDEALEISTVGPFYQALLDMLRDLAKDNGSRL